MFYITSDQPYARGYAEWKDSGESIQPEMTHISQHKSAGW